MQKLKRGGEEDLLVGLVYKHRDKGQLHLRELHVMVKEEERSPTLSAYISVVVLKRCFWSGHGGWRPDGGILVCLGDSGGVASLSLASQLLQPVQKWLGL